MKRKDFLKLSSASVFLAGLKSHGINLIECLRKGEPLDQNVYEGCFWSAVTPLSADSINSGGEPQKFPDFTRGNWKKTQSLKIIS